MFRRKPKKASLSASTSSISFDSPSDENRLVSSTPLAEKRSSQDNIISQNAAPSKKTKFESFGKSRQIKPFATKYFEDICEKSGLTLGTENHTLNCEAMIFISNLKTTLENNVDFPRNVIEFVKGFKNSSNDDNLDKFLRQNISLVLNEDDSQGIVRDSVLRLILNIPSIQETVIDYLLERATQYATTDKAPSVYMILKSFILLDNLTVETKLIEGLLKLLDVAGHSTRLEIITYLPDIVSHLEHQSIVLQLSKLLTDDVDLTPEILECLSCLSLPPDLKIQVQDQMLIVLQTSAPLNFFPNLVNFLLTACPPEHETEVIQRLRESLNWTVIGTKSDDDISNSKVLTVIALKSAISKSKSLALSWLKVINQIKVDLDHKPIDIIVLLILYSTASNREKLVEGVFRKKIKSHLFLCELLDQTFKHFKLALREYLSEMLQIADTIIKTKTDPAVVEFAVNWYILMFKEIKESQRMIVTELISRNCSDDHDALTNALTVLTRISKDDISALKPHSLRILLFVDMLENLNINEIRQVMDLLCGLAYGVEDSFLQDDVQMLLLKQLSSSNPVVKSRGIIGAVMAVKHLVFSGPAQATEETENTYAEVNDLPEGPAKDAATLIELISKSSANSTDMICLYYDEVAALFLSCHNVNMKFLHWFSQAVTDDFQNNFIIDVNEEALESEQGIPVSVQFCINSSDEEEEQIALNIAKLTLGNQDDGDFDVKILPSLFRIVQLTHTKLSNGDLSSIDALLGCGVLMPTVDFDLGLEEFDPDFVSNILDCFVHCINWFRELINAFSSQEEAYMRKKVVERLNGLICLEKHLAMFIKNVKAEYKPPLSMFTPKFDLKSQVIILKETKPKKSGKKGSKRKNNQSGDKDNSIIPATLKTQADTSASSQPQTVSVSTASKCKLNSSFFRTLDLNVLLIFQESLNITDSVGDECFKVPNSKLNLDVVMFVTDEIMPKLSLCLPSKIKKKTYFSKPETSAQCNIKPVDAMEKCIHILPRICHFMECIAEYVQKNLDEHNGQREEIVMLDQKNAESQMCLSNLFNTLSIIFSWSGFQSVDNSNLLKAALKVLATRRDAHNIKASAVKDLVSEACIYTLKYKSWCLLITAAVSLVNFYKILCKISSDGNELNKLMQISLEMLSMAWKDVYGVTEKGLIFNQNLDLLLSSYFIKPEVNTIKSLTWSLREQAPLLTGKDQVLERFNSINKLNFPLLFRAICSALYEAAKADIDKGLTDKQHLELWKNVVMSLKDLTEILKAQENRTNLLTFLKKSIPIFKLFLSQGMPMMELKLSREPDAVVEILRMLQHSTRFLHSLHCHSRLKKDTAFVAYLPQMKLLLESLVYKVKVALVANNCSEAFWMGNLKNKNLHGEVIPSQSSVGSDSEDEAGQLPADEESLSESEDTMDAKSVSNVF